MDNQSGIWQHFVFYLSLLVLAVALRIVPLLAGAPVWHPDEFNYTYFPLLFLEGNLKPYFYYYPHFHHYLLAVLYALFIAIQSLLTGWSFSQTVAHYYFWQTDDILFVGRAVSALLGAGSIVFSTLIARRVYGDWAAMASAAFATVSVLAIRQAPLAAADVPMTFWFVAALWAALRLPTCEKPRDYALAGIFIGLAAASKYHGALVAVAVAAAHLELRRPLLDRRLLLAACVAVATFFLASPYVLLEYERFAQDFGAVAQHVAAGRGNSGPAAWYHTRFTLWHNIGFLAAILSLAGIWSAIKSTNGRVLLTSFAVYYLAIGSGQLVFVRYALPVAALQCVLAAGGLVLVRQRRWRNGLLVLALLQPSYNALSVAQLLAAPDTRSEARQWIEQQVPAGSTLANFGGWAGDVQLETFEHLWWRTKYYVWNAGYEKLEQHLYFFEENASIPPFYHYAIQATNGERASGNSKIFADFSTPYAMLHRHPLGASHIDSSFARELAANAQRVATFIPKGIEEKDVSSYDPLDAYYVPIADFGSIAQPGPAIEIWRVEDIALPPPRPLSPVQALATAYLSGARAALAQQDPAAYISLATRARLLDPGQVDAAYHLNLGIAHRRLGNFQAALQQWQQALIFDSTLVAAHYNSGLVQRYDLGDIPEAVMAWQRALALDKNHLASREELALALGAQHQYQQAAQHWQRLLELSPTHIAAHLNLGLLYLRHLDDPARARMHLGAVLTLKPDHPQSEQIRAILQQR
jgi:tetratricopeptide (TPR) repeat protein/4-amino-4-deoxy-L-arabinose transferase-like glycosyltransferase